MLFLITDVNKLFMVHVGADWDVQGPDCGWVFREMIPCALRLSDTSPWRVLPVAFTTIGNMHINPEMYSEYNILIFYYDIFKVI